MLIDATAAEVDSRLPRRSREVIDKIPDIGKATALVKAERAVVVVRHIVRQNASSDVRADTQRLSALGDGDRVLKLIDVLGAALRKSDRRAEGGKPAFKLLVERHRCGLRQRVGVCFRCETE